MNLTAVQRLFLEISLNFLKQKTNILDYEKIITILQGMLGETAFDRQNIDIALDQLMNSNNPIESQEACWLLGFCYEEGLGVTQDISRCIELYSKSANQGNAIAQYVLGRHLSHRGNFSRVLKATPYTVILQYKEKGAQFYALSAKQGFALAEYHLGNCYVKGTAVNRNVEFAIKLYQRAAQKGIGEALKALADFYDFDTHFFSGQVKITWGWKYIGPLIYIEKDQKQAATLYHQACELGVPYAYVSLARCYEQGNGVKQDYQRALLLNQAAQNLGCIGTAANIFDIIKHLDKKDAKDIPTLDQAVLYYTERKDYSTVGFCYQLGLGVTKDLNLAAKNFEEAIKQMQPCFWDLFLCYQSMYRAYGAMSNTANTGNKIVNTALEQTKTVLLEFYEKIKQAKETSQSIAAQIMRIDRLYCLAYLYERGGPQFEDQDLYDALRCYEQLTAKPLKSLHKTVKDFTKRHLIIEKKQQFTSLPAFEKTIKASTREFSIPGPIASLIAEYAFERSMVCTYTEESSSSNTDESSSSNTKESNSSKRKLTQKSKESHKRKAPGNSSSDSQLNGNEESNSPQKKPKVDHNALTNNPMQVDSIVDSILENVEMEFEISDTVSPARENNYTLNLG